MRGNDLPLHSGMASITRYTTSAGATRWTVRYRQPDGSQTQKRGFRTKRDAELFSATTEVKKATGDYVAPRLGRVTVGQLAPSWLERKELLSRSTYTSAELTWRLHVAPRWESVAVSAVDVLAVEAWITSMIRGGKGAVVVRQAHGVLVGILDDAQKGRRIAGNPAKGVENLPARPVKRRVYLTADDVHRLADEAGEFGPLVLVLAYCGLRWGEAAAGARRRVPAAAAVGVGERDAGVGGASRSANPRAARPDRCRCPNSCSMRCRCSARARATTIWCFLRGTAGICGRRIRSRDGSPKR